MNELKLSQRLERVGRYVRQGSKLADIGSDHAYLPVHLVLTDIISYAIAGEVNEGPFQAAKAQIDKHHLTHSIKAKLGNGLQVLENEEAIDTITIAGMGGSLIVSILSEGEIYLKDCNRLILQPNIGAEQIRKWLNKRNWLITAEELIEEDGHIYEIIVADRHTDLENNLTYTKSEIIFGPFLLKEKSESFIKKWKREKLQLEKIHAQILSAQSTSEREKEIYERIQLIEEVLQ